jgi:membrane protease YdiL (CAAX protease family)
LLFGLWHVPPVWNTANGSTVARIGAAIATVIATTVAGVVFCWLRLRSRSLVAPMLAHVATNSVTFVVAWMMA